MASTRPAGGGVQLRGRVAQPPALSTLTGFLLAALGDSTPLQLRHARSMHTTTVYLICFQPGIPRGARPGNASHYLGSTSYPDPTDRLHEHLTGAGSPLVKAAYDRGLNPEIVATWPGSKQTERAMKRRHRLAHYCPRCGT